jgi:hypothetical protein
VSVLAIVIACVGVLALVLFCLGLVAVRRRARSQVGSFERNVAEADRALEHARALDRGWDRDLMEEACRRALAEARPEFDVDRLHLVLVDDRPGTDDDLAHFVAAGRDGQTRVVLSRTGDRWEAHRVE